MFFFDFQIQSSFFIFLFVMFLFNDKNMFLMFFYSKIYLHCEVIRPTAITYRADAVGDIHLSITTVHHQQA